MSDEIEIEQEGEGPDIDAALSYLERIDLPELRRYVALDMVRMLGFLPDKAVPAAAKIETFLMGKLPREVEK